MTILLRFQMHLTFAGLILMESEYYRKGNFMFDTFNMFNYLKMKGFSNAELANNFQNIEKANQNINEILGNNPNAVLRKIKYTYLDKEKKHLQFDIKIEVVNS